MPTQREYLVPPSLVFENDGPKLVSTNYWQTENAARGLIYLSTNAGCVRLLLPPARAGVAEVADMTANVAEVVLTRGLFEGKYCVEVMFEDRSNSPYCIHIDSKQCDRRWIPEDERKQWTFAIYTELGQIAIFTRCFLRRAARLPYAKPWKGKVQ
jgi:hypothetical protein